MAHRLRRPRSEGTNACSHDFTRGSLDRDAAGLDRKRAGPRRSFVAWQSAHDHVHKDSRTIADLARSIDNDARTVGDFARPVDIARAERDLEPNNDHDAWSIRQATRQADQGHGNDDRRADDVGGNGQDVYEG